MTALRETLAAMPPGTLRVGPYPRPLSAHHALELDAAEGAWREQGYDVQRITLPDEAAVVAEVCDKVCVLLEPGGRKRTYPLRRGEMPKDHYDIDGVRWTVVDVKRHKPALVGATED